MYKYFNSRDLDAISKQQAKDIKNSAHALQRTAFFQEEAYISVKGARIKIFFLERLRGLKGGKYEVNVSGSVNETHIATSNRDLYNYLVGVMIKAHTYLIR